MIKKILIIVLGMFLFSCGNKQEKVVEVEEIEEIVVEDSIVWKLSNDTLFIDGIGEIWDNDYYDSIRNINYKDKLLVSTIVIGKDITRINMETFCKYENLVSVIAHNKYIIFIECTFVDCKKLTSITIGDKILSSIKFNNINCE